MQCDLLGIRVAVTSTNHPLIGFVDPRFFYCCSLFEAEVVLEFLVISFKS